MMKELYTSPELKVTCFAPVERLANDGTIIFEDPLAAAGRQDPAGKSDGDLTVKLP